MTTNIQLLRSSIAYKRPSAGPLLEGQAAINYNQAEPGLFFRLTDGRLTKIGPVAVNNTAVAPNAAPAGETGNSVGETWLDGRLTYHSNILKVYDGTQWVTGNGFTVDNTTGDFTLSRCLTVSCFTTDELTVNGPADISGNITPGGQNCAYYIGKPAERWDYFFGCNFDVTSNGLVGNNLTVGNDAYVDNDFSVSRHVISNLTPDVTATRFLGQDAQRWANLYSIDVNTSGNSTLGSGCGTTTTVNSTATFKCSATFEAPLEVDQIGTSCADTLLIKNTTTFDCPVRFNDEVTFAPGAGIKDLYAFGDIVLGDGCATSTINLLGLTTLSCDMLPDGGDLRNIGSAAKKIKAVYATDVYTGDLHLKNDKGDWTMIEAEDYLTIRNNKTGKTFRLLMEEV